MNSYYYTTKLTCDKDNQLVSSATDDKSEDFLWDGLALIHRGENSFINEPYVTGGNPVMAGDNVLFNDMLGSTLAVNGNPVEMTSFGETGNKNAFFTGKPMIDELGYSFLFRDYNPHQGKWTTTDPLGYPDGWNNLAYVNNRASNCFDFAGAWIESGHRAFFSGYESFDMYQGETLNSKYLDILISANIVVDNYQEEVNSYMHSMKMRTETSEEAIAKTNNFINELIQDARIAVERYEQGYNSLDWTCEFIIKQIGHASHTIQDRLCPQHFEDGQPKTWYTGWYFALNIVHIPELFSTPPSSAKNVFNNWIKNTMAQVIQGNSNIIRQLFE